MLTYSPARLAQIRATRDRLNAAGDGSAILTDLEGQTACDSYPRNGSTWNKKRIAARNRCNAALFGYPYLTPGKLARDCVTGYALELAAHGRYPSAYGLRRYIRDNLRDESDNTMTEVERIAERILWPVQVPDRSSGESK